MLNKQTTGFRFIPFLRIPRNIPVSIPECPNSAGMIRHQNDKNSRPTCQSSFLRNPPDFAGMTGFLQELGGHCKDLPGRCRLGVVCGCWVLLVGIGGCWVLLVGVGGRWVLLIGVGHLLWVLGIIRGRWVICSMWVGAPSCAVHLVLPQAIVVGRDVVVGRGVFVVHGVVVGRGVVVGLEVVVACCRGPGSQLV